MKLLVARGLLIPFFGTALGAACVLFLKKELNSNLQKNLMGFAAGVMTAASVWSLLIPSIEKSQNLGKLAFLPAVLGLFFGIIFLLISDKITEKIQYAEINSVNSSKPTLLLVLAVVIHNIPEGMAVGAVYANSLAEKEKSAFSAAFILALGIAIQNLPEGAIISLPLAAEGIKKNKAFLYGILSGVVEPIAGLLTILLSSLLIPILPYLLSFAAGAMLFVVIRELIPEINEDKNKFFGILMYTLGFSLMMALDVSLG